jgi:uncharacterized membrane protein
MKTTNKFSGLGVKTPLVMWFFSVSVVANLFLIGVLAGVVPGLAPHKHFALMGLATSHSKQMIKQMMGSLEPADAAAFQETIQPQADALKQAHDEVHQAVKNVATIYQQDTPDPSALEAAIAHLSQARTALDDVVGKILLDSYAKLSSDGRHRLTELTRK